MLICSVLPPLLSGLSFISGPADYVFRNRPAAPGPAAFRSTRTDSPGARICPIALRYPVRTITFSEGISYHCGFASGENKLVDPNHIIFHFSQNTSIKKEKKPSRVINVFPPLLLPECCGRTAFQFPEYTNQEISRIECQPIHYNPAAPTALSPSPAQGHS